MEETNIEASQQEETQDMKDYSDEALDRAAEDESKAEGNATEEQEERQEAIAEEQEPEVESAVREKDDENAEKSKLGRKVKRHEELLEEILEKLSSKTEKIPDPEIEEEEEFYLPTSEEEFYSMMKKAFKKNPEIFEEAQTTISSKQQEKRTEYEKKYLGKVQEFQDSDVYEEVMAELQKSGSDFNVMHDIDTPERDAELNYARAEAYILRGKKTQNLKQDTIQSTGVNAQTKVTPRQAKPIELDPDAADFVRRTGMTEEQVSKALGK